VRNLAIRSAISLRSPGLTTSCSCGGSHDLIVEEYTSRSGLPLSMSICKSKQRSPSQYLYPSRLWRYNRRRSSILDLRPPIPRRKFRIGFTNVEQSSHCAEESKLAAQLFAMYFLHGWRLSERLVLPLWRLRRKLLRPNPKQGRAA
jgi:hypothetical protein